MLGRDDLIWAMSLECDVAAHLYSKLPRTSWETTLAYRPSPEQRSLLELLRYYSYCGIGGSLACVEGGWDGYKRVAARSEAMAADDFPSALERQKTEIAELLGALSDDDLGSRTAQNPLGAEMKLSRALYEMPLRWLVGYRMQLFLYARAVGAEVGTPECWYGITLP